MSPERSRGGRELKQKVHLVVFNEDGSLDRVILTTARIRKGQSVEARVKGWI